jgi:ABC-type thiamin/hydroxymethylpyrimidine transport system permease subunit
MDTLKTSKRRARAVSIVSNFIAGIGAAAGWVVFGQRGRYFSLVIAVLVGMALADLIRMIAGVGPAWSPENINKTNRIAWSLTSAALAAVAMVGYLSTRENVLLGGILFFGLGAVFLFATRRYKIPVNGSTNH